MQPETGNQEMPTTGERPALGDARLVWITALIVAAIGAWIMYDAIPGANWGIWTVAASLGLILVARTRGTLGNATLLVLGVATVLAAGAAVTADQLITGLICLGVMLFLSLAMLLAIDPAPDRVSTLFVITSPFVAGGNAVGESFRRALDLSGSFRSSRVRAAVRGAAITIPIVVFFALLLAAADPVFASWREEIARIIDTWSFIPRLIFFFVLMVVVLGAYSYADRANRPAAASQPTGQLTENGNRWLGATERLILISGVTALFWLFIAVQLSYLFGNVPRIVGSGMTFAEYARRGFGELTIVATCSIILIIISERHGRANGHAQRIKLLTLALLVAVTLMLISAYHRVSLYEAAYGYTVSRLYAQVYMLVLSVALVALTVELLDTLDPNRLFRRALAAAVIAFTVLVFWNHEGWIAAANLDRPGVNGELDVRYIVNELSPNAVPVLVSRLNTLPEPGKTLLRQELATRYGRGKQLREGRWFEWNLRRQQARAALASIGLPLPASTTTTNSPSTPLPAAAVSTVPPVVVGSPR